MSDSVPVNLIEDDDGGRRFLIYNADSGINLEILYEGDGLWMTQAQAADLFGVTVASISRHIANIYEEGELERAPTITEIETVRLEGGRRVARTIEHYSLDVIISVGYRVSSKQATLFRRWATDKLVQFATKGFVVDKARLRRPENFDRIAELREIVREIRADEANVYRELRAICAMCADYDGSAASSREFYMQMQAKLLYAVTSHTPAEIVRSRADAKALNMGLTNWPNDNIRKVDVSTSKSYLADAELAELNRLTVILLDIFEDQLKIGKLTLMSEAAALLASQLRSLNRSVLTSGGRVSHETAKRHAEAEYDKYKASQKALRHAQADEVIRSLRQAESVLPKRRPRPK